MNQDPDLSFLLNEIEQMKLVEKRADAAFWVHKILKDYKILKDFTDNLPDKFKDAKIEDENLQMTAEGFKYKNNHVAISADSLKTYVDGKFIFEFSKNKSVGDCDILEDIANCFAEISLKFRTNLMQQILAYEKELIEELENF